MNAPPVPFAKPARPVGVILSAILLGLFAAVQLLFAALMALSGFILERHPPETPANGAPVPPAIVLIGVTVGFGLFLAILAAWAITTLVGLVRLKNWARYSVLVIGGCLAVLGILSAAGSLLAITMSSQLLAGNPAVTPESAPHVMQMTQVIFVVSAVFYLLLAAVGIWWLIYFNLRATAAAFQPPPYGLAYTPTGTFPHPAEPDTTPRTPVAVIVLACLFLLSAACCLPVLLLPFPGFLFGFLLHGPVVKVIYLVLAALMAAIGIGLLRRDNRARIATYALILVGVLNLALMVTPWYRAGFQQFNLELTSSLHPSWAPPTPTIVFSGPMMMASAILGIAVYALIAWVLYRHRAAFTRSAPIN